MDTIKYNDLFEWRAQRSAAGSHICDSWHVTPTVWQMMTSQKVCEEGFCTS